MQKEIESAYQTALKKKDNMTIALALSPFEQKTAELVNSGAYMNLELRRIWEK